MCWLARNQGRERWALTATTLPHFLAKTHVGQGCWYAQWLSTESRDLGDLVLVELRAESQDGIDCNLG